MDKQELLDKAKKAIEDIDRIADPINEKITQSKYTVFLWIGIFTAGFIAGLFI